MHIVPCESREGGMVVPTRLHTFEQCEENNVFNLLTLNENQKEIIETMDGANSIVEKLRVPLKKQLSRK